MVLTLCLCPAPTHYQGMWKEDRAGLPFSADCPHIGEHSLQMETHTARPQTSSTPLATTEAQTDCQHLKGSSLNTGWMTLDLGWGGNASLRCQCFCGEGLSNCTVPIKLASFLQVFGENIIVCKHLECFPNAVRYNGRPFPRPCLQGTWGPG